MTARLRSKVFLDALRPIAAAAKAWGVDGQHRDLPDNGPICLPLTLGEARAAIAAVEAAEKSQ